MRDGQNRFNRNWLGEFNAALDRVEASDAPAALVTTGEGKFYSNGLDLDWLGSVGSEATGFLSDVPLRFGRLLGFPVVTVAAVTGHAFAAGAMLATAHDFVIMREDRGYWCLPEADLGLPLTAEMFAVIDAKLPRRAAHEAIVTGRRYDARQAQAAGIVHWTASENEVLTAAVKLARELAAKDRAVLAAHKRLLYGEVVRLCAAGQREGE